MKPVIAEIVLQRYMRGDKVLDISAETLVPLSTMYYLLHKNGVPFRGSGRKRFKPLVSQYIDQKMKDNDIGYAELAEGIGLTTNHVRRVLVGEKPMSATFAYLIEQHMGWDGDRIRSEAENWWKKNRVQEVE